ncbi:MAG: cell division protein ZapB [Vicinamibacterales bacterium]
MTKTLRDVELEPIVRLEAKVRQLVDALTQLKSAHEAGRADNQRLTRELEAVTSRLGVAEGVARELDALREERDQVKRRVAEMLDQLDNLDL